MRGTDTAVEDGLRERFLAGMSHAASTVYVVTTAGEAGQAGVTVSAMTSVTADPPVILVCVHHQSPTAGRIVENGVFCVNLLRHSQSGVADVFAGRVRTGSGDKFEGVGWERMETGSPRVSDPLVAFDCRLVKADRIGTHHVFYGEVVDVHLGGDDGTPLLYARRAYGTPLPIDPGHGPDAKEEDVDGAA